MATNEYLCVKEKKCNVHTQKRTHLRKVIFLTTPSMKSVYLCKNFGVKAFRFEFIIYVIQIFILLHLQSYIKWHIHSKEPA